MLTGRDNYMRFGKALGIDLLNHPELAANPRYMFKIAAYYWKHRVSNNVTNFTNTPEVTRHIKSNPDKENVDRRDSEFRKFVDLLGL